MECIKKYFLNRVILLELGVELLPHTGHSWAWRRTKEQDRGRMHTADGRVRAVVFLPSQLHEVLPRMRCVHTSLHSFRSMPYSSISQNFPCSVLLCLPRFSPLYIRAPQRHFVGERLPTSTRKGLVSLITLIVPSDRARL